MTDEAQPAEAELMTPAEIAEKFRVNTHTVNKWLREGHLPAVVTPGGRRLAHRDDVAAFLKPVGGRATTNEDTEGPS